MHPTPLFFHDDGLIPNSRFPVLLYRHVFPEPAPADPASWLEQRFAANNWTNAWRNGIYNYHHYHSTAHEVLGVFAGTARLQLGGEKGQAIVVNAGDVLVLPAGTGHKNLESSGLGVVGAYWDGCDWDVNRGTKEEREQAERNMAALPIPARDPMLGVADGLPGIWR